MILFTDTRQINTLSIPERVIFSSIKLKGSFGEKNLGFYRNRGVTSIYLQSVKGGQIPKNGKFEVEIFLNDTILYWKGFCIFKYTQQKTIYD